MRKKERGERGKGREGKGKRDRRESLVDRGRRERGRERGGEGKFRGPAPPQMFFLEPRLVDGHLST